MAGTPITTITDIETAVLTRLTATLTGVRNEANQKDAAGLYPGPSVSVAIFEGTFEKITQKSWRQKVTVHILLTFKHERGEQERRRGINPILQGVILSLLLRDLGLAMDPLKPVRFREVTDSADDEARKIVYLIEFATSFCIAPVDDEEAADLLRIGLAYYLKPGDAVVDATDVVTLST